ncbi:hypothetical protein SEA_GANTCHERGOBLIN_48 [Arthrobacter phage GantcherGoblin]|nr:hypothetical protein SEA_GANTCHERGOBLIN_48 [Arthrobacter phage GantcherGoblin]
MTERKRLEKLLDMATKLGFTDDAEHWQNELKKLEGENNA